MGCWNPLELLFPAKCVLCRERLEPEESGFCTTCLRGTPRFTDESRKIRNIDHCMALWYYEGQVRASLLRYKFYGREHYGAAFGRLLGEKVKTTYGGQFDLVTYVPVSLRRNLKRGYDQVQILSKYLCKTLGCSTTQTLKKIRHNAAQSSLGSAGQRRRNVEGAYRALDPDVIRGKRILIIDDIITTGSTLSECGKILKEAGAESVLCAAVAAGRERIR